MRAELDDGRARLLCPCGAHIDGSTRDDLRARLQEHLQAEHPSFCSALWQRSGMSAADGGRVDARTTQAAPAT